MSKVKVIDNFLDINDFKKIQAEMIGNHFPWYFSSIISHKESEMEKIKKEFPKPENYYYKNTQLVHTFYVDHSPHSEWLNILKPLTEKINPKAWLRIKGNMTTRQSKKYVHGLHNDYTFDCTTSIYYLCNTNGATVFADGTEIECVENRLISFPSKMSHSGSCHTGQGAFRVVLNLNYIE